MLISTDTELRQFLPSSVIKDVKTVAMLIERAEDAHLRPVLGDALYDKINELHDDGVSREDDANAYQLVTLCQSTALYFAMADNVGLLSVSYNTGGGFSIVTTDGYSPADEKEKDRLERDLWKNAWRDIDRLLDLLEADAKSKKPEYAELWKESEWFYFQGDLLLTTAKEANRYLTAEEKRTFDRKRFVEMLGDLRFCQMSFISKAIGDDFLEWLVEYGYKPCEEPQGAVAVNDKVVKKAKELLSMALMAAMRYRRDHRGADENDANLALFRATEYIKQHQDDFGKIINTSPLYTPPPPEEEDNEHHHKHMGHRKPKHVAHCECLDGDALFAPFM